MDTPIPSAAAVRTALEGLGHAEIVSLSRMSNVPFTTLWKVRAGETANPGIETVRRFWHYIDEVRRPVASAQPTPAEPATAAG